MITSQHHILNWFSKNSISSARSYATRLFYHFYSELRRGNSKFFLEISHWSFLLPSFAHLCWRCIASIPDSQSLFESMTLHVSLLTSSSSAQVSTLCTTISLKHTVVTLNCTRVRLIDCRFGTQLGWLLNRLCRHYCESSGCEVDERVKSSFQEPRSRTLNSVWKAKHIRRAAQHYDNEFCDSLVSPLRQQSALFRGSWHTCSTHDGRRKQHIIYFITFLACIKKLSFSRAKIKHTRREKGESRRRSREWEEELRTLVWVFVLFWRSAKADWLLPGGGVNK